MAQGTGRFKVDSIDTDTVTLLPVAGSRAIYADFTSIVLEFGTTADTTQFHDDAIYEITVKKLS